MTESLSSAGGGGGGGGGGWREGERAQKVPELTSDVNSFFLILKQTLPNFVTFP